MTHLFVCRDKGHSHEPHNELASVVLSSSGIGIREIEYANHQRPTLRSPDKRHSIP